MARVLVVDDDRAGLELRCLTFTRAGHRVFAAQDAESARRLFEQNSPQIVVLDLRLPEAADGIGLIREFHVSAPGTCIVVLAGWPADLDGHPEAAMVRVVLAKPVRSEKLLAVIAEQAEAQG